MTSEHQNFTVHQGQQDNIPVTVKEGGVVKIITGATILFRLRASVFSTVNLMEKTVGSGITITDGANGVFELEFITSDFDTSFLGEYYYEARVTLGGGSQVTTKGIVTVKKSITI